MFLDDTTGGAVADPTSAPTTGEPTTPAWTPTQPAPATGGMETPVTPPAQPGMGGVTEQAPGAQVENPVNPEAPVVEPPPVGGAV